MQNTLKQQNKKVIPLHTEQSFYYWMSKSINRQKTQGNTSRLLIIGLIVWNLILTVNTIKPTANIPTFTDKLNNQIMIEELIPPYDLQPIPVSELI